MGRRLLGFVSLFFVFAAGDPGTSYFREHAGDRVKWQRWGQAAFDRAQKENKPIALVVGSFAPHSTREAHAAIESDPATIATLNGDFIPVLLDRAEWPEVAKAYAAAAGSRDSSDVVVHALTPGLEWLDDASATTLQSIAERWKSRREEYLEESRLKVRRLRLATGSDPATPDLELLIHTNRDLAAKTLRDLDRSPLHDLLGGAFFRGMRDADRPFFDLDLADQARFASLFLEAARSLGDSRFAEVSRDVLEFAVRDMRVAGGTAFYDSQQADSLVPIDGPVYVDGGWYLWDRAEIRQTFGAVIGSDIVSRFGVPARGKEILRPVRTDEPGAAVAAAIARMLDMRSKRPMPRRDEPVLESNARMISALARGGAAFNDDRFIKAAVAAGAVMRKHNGPLSRRPGVPATASDDIAVVQASIDLYEATLETAWLDAAIDAQSHLDTMFWNDKANRYEGGQEVPEPVRDFVLTADVLTPLNRDAAANLIRLAAITGRDDFRGRAAAIATAFTSDAWIQRTAAAPITRVVIFGSPYREDTAALIRAGRSSYDPMRVIVHGGRGKHPAPANIRIGSLQPNPDGTPSAYVCRPAGCSNAFTDPQALAAALR